MIDDKYSVTLQESVDEVNKSQSKEKTIGEKYFNDVYSFRLHKLKGLQNGSTLYIYEFTDVFLNSSKTF